MLEIVFKPMALALEFAVAVCAEIERADRRDTYLRQIKEMSL